MNKLLLHKRFSIPDSSFPYSSLEDLPLQEQRSLPRAQMQNDVYYQTDSSEIVQTQTKDLSADGVCLYTNFDVDVNQRVNLKIFLSENRSLQIDGVVMWKKVPEDAQGYVGIAFYPLPENIYALLLEHSLLIK